MIRWVSHQTMPADSLTKAAFLSTNGALEHVFRIGTYALVQEEEEELKYRAECPEARSRGRRASAARLTAEDARAEAGARK